MLSYLSSLSEIVMAGAGTLDKYAFNMLSSQHSSTFGRDLKSIGCDAFQGFVLMSNSLSKKGKVCWHQIIVYHSIMIKHILCFILQQVIGTMTVPVNAKSITDSAF